MKDSMKLYDEIQYDLVVRSEKPHQFGLRDKATSGDICNRILIEFLRNEFPHFRFCPGTITLAERRTAGYRWSSADLSPQVDIICYLGHPYDEIFDYVVVPLKQVKFTVECKKWISPSDLQRVQKQIERLQRFTRKPVFLVTFRHHGSFDQLKKLSPADYFFAFSGRSHGYPEDAEGFRTESLRSGELLELRTQVENLLR